MNDVYSYHYLSIYRMGNDISPPFLGLNYKHLRHILSLQNQLRTESLKTIILRRVQNLKIRQKSSFLRTKISIFIAKILRENRFFPLKDLAINCYSFKKRYLTLTIPKWPANHFANFFRKK